MISFFANIFGYLLNFIYNIIQNYGVAMIIFSIIVKIILLPISISQQKTLKKTTKVQEEMKILQVKYKNNPEELQREMFEVYKREKVNPFSGCLNAIIQIVLILSVFYIVRSPLTYMKKVDKAVIEQYETEISETSENRNAYPEISVIREKASEDERVNINMEFLSLDLSSIPSTDFSDWKVYVIPALYVITSFISMKITTAMQYKSKDKNAQTENSENKEDEEFDVMAQTNRNMTYMMPIIAISISFIAPLGLALYWLTNNVLMIIERLVLNIFFKDKEEEANA